MKKIISLLLIAFMAIGVNAGNDNKTTAPYKVGDYYNDGTKEGIVFVVYDGGIHGKIVSLDESEKEWTVSDIFNNSIGAKAKGGGMGNMNKIRKQYKWKKKYPAFAWCVSLGKNWYLPAIDELLLIYNNVNVINRVLNEKGYGEIMEKSYWSSTEDDIGCALYVYMKDGFSCGALKFCSIYVRAVATF